MLVILSYIHVPVTFRRQLSKKENEIRLSNQHVDVIHAFQVIHVTLSKKIVYQILSNHR